MFGQRKPRLSLPGCTHDRYIDLHHRTTKANLLALCTFHHRLVHEGGFTIELDEAGEPRFLAPEGEAIPFVPTPAPRPPIRSRPSRRCTAR